MNKSNEDTPILIFIIILFLGVSLMIYPIISNYLNANMYNKIITSYMVVTDSKTKERKKKLLEEAKDYNKKLAGNTVVDISNSNSEKSQIYSNILKITGDGNMGYVEIPKIDVKLPIYHGTSEKFLSRGAGHLEGTSFPIGGASTHAVISAHRGMPSSKLFTDLNLLEINDVFYVKVLDNILAYKVDKITVVTPDDLKDLKIEKNKDYVTLLTCTPYGINTHRLLVRGSRIDYNQLDVKHVARSKNMFISDIVILIGFDISFLMVLILIILKKGLYLKDEVVISKK